jgi:23S rRNA (guanosine2251-2'-O)-methyltransferase
MSDVLYGRNAVREALRARRRRFKHLSIATGAQDRTALADIRALAEQAGVSIQQVERRELDRHLRGANHQSIALHASDYPYVDIADMLELAAQRDEPALLLLLDHLQDPQNVGTLLRTAEAAGIHGIVLPARRAVAVTPAVVNASSGATEHLPIAMVSNLAQTVAALQKAGLWVVGLENDPMAQAFDQADLSGPLAFVLGAEGPGLARLTRERCDFLVRLPLSGQIESLNAAVAGSIVLYHTWRQRSRHAST